MHTPGLYTKKHTTRRDTTPRMGVSVKFTVTMALGLSILVQISGEHTDALDDIQPEEYGLPNTYKDFYKINSKNFERRVINSEEVWIVILSPAAFDFEYNWKKHARQYKGTVFFGVVDAKQEPKLALTVHNRAVGNYDWNSQELACIFKGQKTKPAVAHNPWKALKLATKMLPKGDLKQFIPTKEDEMYNFVVPAFYHSKPYSRFPVLMIYDENKQIPLVHRIIGNDKLFSVYFDFRLMKSSEFGHLKMLFPNVPKPEEFPTYLGLVGKEPENGGNDLSFDIVQFVNEKFKNPHSYKCVSEYLFWMNREYRDKLPGRKARESVEDMIKPLAGAINHRLNTVKAVKMPKKDEL